MKTNQRAISYGIIVLALGLTEALAQQPAGGRSYATPDAGADQEIVKLNPFVVSTAGDKGYQSRESNTQSRFASELKNTPFSLTVLPAKFLADAGIVNLSDAVNYSTGSVGYDKVNSPDVGIFQRGFGTLQYLVDGIPTRGGFDSIGVERVEVLSGPASVLYGISNPGGSVNYTTKQPRENPFAEISQVVGLWSTFRTTVDVGGPLGSSSAIRYRIPASYSVSDGYFRNSNSRSFYAGPIFTWMITPQTKLTAQLEYRNAWQIPVSYTIGIIAGVSPLSWAQLSLGLPRDFNGNTAQMYMKSEQIRPTVTVFHSLSERWQIRNVASNYRRVYSEAYATRGATSALTNPPFQYPRQAVIDDTTTSDFQDNLDVIGTFDVPGGSLVVDFGAQWSDGSSRYNAKSGLGAGATSRPPWLLLDPSTWDYSADYLAGATTTANNRGTFETAAYSVLAQLRSLQDRLFVSAGLRHDRVENTLTNYFNNTYEAFVSKATTGQIGVLYRPRPAWGIYASHSTSFNPVNRTLLNAQMQPFNAVPVIGKGYEVGIKNERWDGRFVHSLALYRIQLDKNVVNALGISNTNASFTYQLQGGLQESQGVEYNFNAAFSNRISLLGGLSYNDAHIKRDVAAIVGQRLVGAFRFKANAFARYDFSGGALDGGFVGLGAIYVSNAPGYTGTLNQLCNPSFLLVNPVLGYGWTQGKRRIETQLNVQNALDRNYVPYSNSAPLPRNVQLTIKVIF